MKVKYALIWKLVIFTGLLSIVISNVSVTVTGQNPDYTYTAAGTYTAALTVTDNDGTTALDTAQVTVTPVLTAEANGPYSGTVDVAISFSGSASGGAVPYSYNWDFGDGGSSTAQNPDHTYTDAGTYTAALTVTDNDGTAALDTAQVTVTPVLTAQANGPYSGTVDAAISFSGSASGGAVPYSYNWDFGDGGSSTAQNPEYTYTAAGTYTAALTVTDNDGTAALDTAQVTVTPVLTAQANGPYSGTVDVAISFSGSASGGAVPYSYNWDFGDGGSSIEQNPDHTYTDAGTYTAALTVTDNDGTAALDTAQVNVTPVLTAQANGPYSGTVDVAISFSGSASGGAVPYFYNWDFGDGGSSTAQNPEYTYTAAGTYTATLNVTDNDGSAALDTAQVTVTPVLTAQANGPYSGTVDAAISFSGSASGGAVPYSYNWDFGDGGSSTAQNPDHTYTAAGTYTAALTVTDNDGSTALDTAQVNVTQVLTAQANGPYSGTVDAAISFSGSASGGAVPYSYNWDFGDGGSSIEQNPDHTYTDAGTYTAALTVTDNDGTAALDTAQVNVTQVLTAQANGPYSGTVDVAISFSGSASGGAVPYFYNWDFGDGGSSTAQNPEYTYTAAGTYTTALTVTDNDGSTALDTAQVTVTPVLTAQANGPYSGTVDAAISFSGSASGGAVPYSYNWDFGDGGSSTAQNPDHTYTAAGTYTAALTVTDNDGTAALDTAQVTVTQVLTAQANGPYSGTVDVAINFNGSASGGAVPYSYNWDFGDGGSSTEQNPDHTYTAAGTYTAALTVTDNDGSTALDTAQVNVTHVLTAQANGPYSGTVDVAVNFNGSASGGAVPYSYNWDFGDGGSSTAQNPEYTYTDAGTYTAALTVTDNDGSTALDTAQVNVTHVLTAQANGPYSGTVDVAVNFNGSASGGAIPYSYNWDFGDGGSSTAQNPEYTYTAAGTYTAALTVTDNDGTAALDTAQVTVTHVLTAQANGPYSGTVDIAVNFNGSASGGAVPYSYNWDFGDGGSSTEQNPDHTYTAAGTYTAALTVTDNDGTAAQDTAQVTVTQVLTAQANGPYSGTVDVAINFSGSASGGAVPYSYNWDFGDGGSSTAQNPEYTYTAAGTYTAALTVTDNDGTAAQDTAQVTVTQVLTAQANGPYSGTVDVAINFSGSASGGAVPYSYNWDFGDGGSSTAQNPDHTYTAAGTYTAALTVTDNDGTAALDTAQVTVTQVLIAEANGPYSGTVDVVISFNGSASGGAVPYSYNWDFGDGGSSTAQNPDHTYTAAGTYTAALTVTDNDGSTALDTAQVNVTHVLTAQANGPYSGTVDVEISFNGSASGGAVPYSYNWDFGDGVSSTAQNPDHTYTDAGTYTAALTVTDNDGSTALDTAQVTVTQVLTAQANGPYSGTVDVEISFNGSASGGAVPYSYNWDFGDGVSSTAQNPDHTYTAAGTYTAALTVTDNDGSTALDTAQVTVTQVLTAQANGPYSGTVDVAINFNGSASGGAVPYSYNWDFGDGGSSTAQNPDHTYTDAGTYTAALTVTDNDGSTALDTAQVNVTHVLTAQANGPYSGTVDVAVNFNGSASGGAVPYSYNWDFGDGGSSTAQNPEYTYTAAGTYTAALTVTDNDGSTALDTAQVTVTPVLTAEANGPYSGTVDIAISFSGSASGGAVPYSYNWDFGDGGSSIEQNPDHTYTAAGTYTATLTVTDNDGSTALDTAQVNVTPVLTAQANGPYSGTVDVAISFSGSASGGAVPYSYNWDFGDGGSSTAQNPDHTYTAAGTYTAALTVTDNDGSTALDTAQVNVTHVLTAQANGPYSGTVDVAVNFNGSASAGAVPYSYNWDFGDGGSSTAQNPDHTYTAAGTYTAALTVTDNDGTAALDTAQVNVTQVLTAQANGPYSGTVDLAISFNGSASGGAVPYSYNWDFGDGGSSTEQNPDHTYTAAGTYTAALTVTDNDGTAALDTAQVNVTQVLIAEANGPYSGTVNVAISFNGSASGGAVPYSYNWDFGDGGSSTEQNPDHTYTAAGTYTAALTVTDNDGTAALDTAQVNVTPVSEMAAEKGSSKDSISLQNSAAPTVGTVELYKADHSATESQMTPPNECAVLISAGDANTLTDIDTITVVIRQHDYTGPDEVHHQATYTWTPGGTNSGWDFTSPAGTHWDCTSNSSKPDLAATSGDWYLNFKPSKVAVEDIANGWDIEVTVSDGVNADATGSKTGIYMLLYVEINAIDESYSFGDVDLDTGTYSGENPIGTPADHNIDVTAIANGNYKLQSKTNAMWTSPSGTATVYTADYSPLPEGAVRLIDENEGTYGGATLVPTSDYSDITGYSSIAGPTATEAGETREIYQWLEVASAGLRPDTYEGTYYVQIANGA